MPFVYCDVAKEKLHNKVQYTLDWCKETLRKVFFLLISRYLYNYFTIIRLGCQDVIEISAFNDKAYVIFRLC